MICGGSRRRSIICDRRPVSVLACQRRCDRARTGPARRHGRHRRLQRIARARDAARLRDGRHRAAPAPRLGSTSCRVRDGKPFRVLHRRSANVDGRAANARGAGDLVRARGQRTGGRRTSSGSVYRCLTLSGVTAPTARAATVHHVRRARRKGRELVGRARGRGDGRRRRVLRVDGRRGGGRDGVSVGGEPHRRARRAASWTR